MAGDFRGEHNVMEMARSDVLLDPAFTVPAVPGASAGVGWIRCMVPRFCEGEPHARRRALTERVIALIGRPERLSSPTAALPAAMGLPPGLEGDVAVVAQAYLPVRRCRRRRTRRRTDWWPRAPRRRQPIW